ANLGDDQRTMQDVMIGLLLASPLFYLTGGNRNITLRFYLEDSAFKIFKDYVTVFAKTAKKTPQGVLNEILSSAFLIDYTSDKGWRQVDNYSVLVPGIDQTGDTSLEIQCKLDITDPPFALYQAALHGTGYTTSLPAVRLQINNDNSHNAYSFLHR